MPNKQYIGDGVYIEARDTAFIGKEIVLTTEDGVNITNTIVLGGQEVMALIDYYKAC
jgi:hypothetical protein